MHTMHVRASTVLVWVSSCLALLSRFQSIMILTTNTELRSFVSQYDLTPYRMIKFKAAAAWGYVRVGMLCKIRREEACWVSVYLSLFLSLSLSPSLYLPTYIPTYLPLHNNNNNYYYYCYYCHFFVGPLCENYPRLVWHCRDNIHTFVHNMLPHVIF